MNNWYVLTGAPSSGKTSVLLALEKKGYKVVHEAAREIIDQGLRTGKTLKQIRRNEDEFQINVFQLKIENEKNLSSKNLIFFDRAIPDTLAYNKLLNEANTKQLMEAVKNCSYKKVFMFEQLEYEKDYARTESKEEADKLQEYLKECYTELGIEIITVPKMSIQKRTSFILGNL